LNKEAHDQFLIEMYKQLMNEIGQHIIVVWQSIGIVFGSFAITGLAEKEIIPIDWAISILLAICLWSVVLTIDSSYWYNRNLCIISNIEKYFLTQDDLSIIHYYFGKHRPDNKMITTLKVQTFLSTGIAFIVLLYHFYARVIPGFSLPMSCFEPPRALPYIVVLISIAVVCVMRRKRNSDYDEFLRNSPGITIDTSSIDYGGGHGYKEGGGESTPSRHRSSILPALADHGAAAVRNATSI